MSTFSSFLVTGGAGFVGSNLCMLLREAYPAARVVAADNLRRRGSELNLPRLNASAVEFAHVDIRNASDLKDLDGSFDVMIEASAEPSVHSGLSGSPHYLEQTNLVGTLNCLDFARSRVGKFIFLSTSRVYSIPALLEIPLQTTGSRFELDPSKPLQFGLTSAGVTEDFSVAQYRSLYGATKLASELFVQEYAQAFRLAAVVNRCGVIAGPWQMGKVDQGVFTLWMARHVYGQAPGRPLMYTGFGGRGLQVRDLLHPKDLFALILKQLASNASVWNGSVFNVGGGSAVSVSLKELTQICEEISGNRIDIGLTPNSSAVDIPFYVTDFARAKSQFGWEPKISVRQLMQEIHDWLLENEKHLKPLFLT
jgi:CDP-paratose 2-epimerase